MSLTVARQTSKYVQVLEELSCLVICVLLNPLIGYSFPISTMQATTARKVLKLPQPHRVHLSPTRHPTNFLLHKFSSSLHSLEPLALSIMELSKASEPHKAFKSPDTPSKPPLPTSCPTVRAPTCLCTKRDTI